MTEENFDGHVDMEGIPENSNPPDIQGSGNHLGEAGEKKWPGWPGETVFRMLVPAQKVGGIIGRKGEYIKKTCEETKARIKILDWPGSTERIICCLAGFVEDRFRAGVSEFRDLRVRTALCNSGRLAGCIGVDEYRLLTLFCRIG